jgi:hypothetical protein
MQGATPSTVGEEWTAYEGVLPRNYPGTLQRSRWSSIKITNDIRLMLASEPMGSFLSQPRSYSRASIMRPLQRNTWDCLVIDGRGAHITSGFTNIRAEA